MILHVLADFGQEVKPLGEQYVVQGLGDIAAVPKANLLRNFSLGGGSGLSLHDS
jgi:hypothetical protein